MTPLRRLAYLGYLVLFACAATWIAYHRYVQRIAGSRRSIEFANTLSERVLNSGLPGTLQNSLGYFLSDERNAFVKAGVQPKPPGVVRIGAMGGSLTFGYEVSPGSDFPALLQRMFFDHGRGRVEVLNFGVPTFNFHQIFRLWDQFARRFNLDYLLLGPNCNQSLDDLSFSANQFPLLGNYLHGRYVIEKEGLRFVDVLGASSWPNRTLEYLGFFPHQQYLRYDIWPPAILAALVPEGRLISNPFYYGSLPPLEEAARIRKALLETMRHSEHVISLDCPSGVAESGMRGAKLTLPDWFPYLRTTHPSEAGNAIVAKAFFDLLTAQETIHYPVISFLPGPQISPLPKSAPALDQYQGARILLDRRPLGRLIFARAAIAPMDEPVNFRDLGIKGVLWVKSREVTPLDSLALPLGFPLREGAPLVARWPIGRDQAERTLELGQVRLWIPEAGLGVVDLSGATTRVVSDTQRESMLEAHPVGENWRLLAEEVARGTAVKGFLDGTAVYDFRAAPDGGIWLVPLTSRHAYFKPEAAMGTLPDSLLDVQAPEKARLELFNLKGARAFTIGTWQRQQISLPQGGR